jgi:hypothetical protein
MINTVQKWLEGDKLYCPKNILGFTCSMSTGCISHACFLISQPPLPPRTFTNMAYQFLYKIILHKMDSET